MSGMKPYRPRPKPGHTYLPCPGCGEEHHRPQNKVCDGCRRLIELGQKTIGRDRSNPELGAYTTRPPSYASFGPPVARVGDLDQRPGARLARALAGLATLLAEDAPAQGYGHPPLFPSATTYYSGTDARLLRRDVAELLQAADQAIGELVKAAHEDGQRRGADLLGRLAQVGGADWLNDEATRRKGQ